jgi:DNA-binding transcriptional regulator of glucitol operon
MGNDAGAIIIVTLVGAWIVQLWMSHRQLRRFYKRLKVIRKDGLTAVGLDGNRLSGRTYGVLTVDPQTRRIAHAERFAGATILASLKPVPQLEGHTLDDLLAGKLNAGISGRLQRAFANAARDIQGELDKPKIDAAPPAAADEEPTQPPVNEGIPA